jgi:hypothetical protein
MRKTILITTIAALSVAAVSLLPTMPILAEKQTPVERRDALLSADALELMWKAKDLPVQQIEDLI